jgi:hypothetical protein
MFDWQFIAGSVKTTVTKGFTKFADTAFSGLQKSVLKFGVEGKQFVGKGVFCWYLGSKGCR